MSTIKVVLNVTQNELNALQIPDVITDEQLTDSGYTYKFGRHKEAARRILMDKVIPSNIQYEIRKSPYGVEVIASLDTDDIKV